MHQWDGVAICRRPGDEKSRCPLINKASLHPELRFPLEWGVKSDVKHMELEFFGAAGEVTGSCHILRVGDQQVLLDCGLIQGRREDEARNLEPFPFDPRAIDAVVLSHAHIDHSGRLPLLVRQGFKGPIHTHNATRDLAHILLRDSASLHERDADWQNRKRERKGLAPIEPLYTRADAEAALKLVQGYRYEQAIDVAASVKVRFHDAGHIMGSALVEVNIEHRDRKCRLVFSGDLGQHDTPILRDPVALETADVVLMESTYGGRLHRERAKTIEEIGAIISAARAGRGNILIPAFAVGRSQEVLYQFGVHFDEWDLQRWHVFLDSPMAVEASKVYWEYPHLYDEEATKFRETVHEMPHLHNLHLTADVTQSKNINRIRSGAIVLAGSGMCTGGRILHHLKHNLWRPECHVVIVGYQAYGTLGRALVERRHSVRIHREGIRVKATIHTVGGLSAHGDEADLSRWYGGFQNRPPVFLVHGEVSAAKALKKRLEADHKARVRLGKPGLTLDLTNL